MPMIPILTRAKLLLLAMLVAAGLTACGVSTVPDADAQLERLNGNGMPSGAHYNLNIIGVPKDKSADMDGNNGHRIFVPLWGNAKIHLQEGDYGVIDANATDSDGATFQLPNPDPDNDGITEYSIYARALGTPGGSSTMTTCATTEIDGVEEEVCSTYQQVFVRDRGRPAGENVSKELLYIYYDLDGDGTAERYNLFADELEDYFWSYDNHGLKLVQLRFYEVSTDVN